MFPLRSSSNRLRLVFTGCLLALLIPLAGCDLLPNPAGPAPTLAPSQDQAPAPTPVPSENLAPSPAPAIPGVTGSLLIDGILCAAENCRPSGITLVDLTTLETRRVGAKDYELEDVSPDGQRLLVSQERNLLIVDLQGELQAALSDSLLDTGSRDAYWLSERQVVFIGAQGEGAYIYLVDPESGELAQVTGDEFQPSSLTRTHDPEYIYWMEGDISGAGLFNLGSWRSRIDGAEHIPLDVSVYSPNGAYQAYWVTADPAESGEGGVAQEFYIANADGGAAVKLSRLELAEKEFLSFYEGLWSPDGKLLLLEVMHCDPACDSFRYLLVSVVGRLLGELPPEAGQVRHLGTWSPDSQRFIYWRMIPTEDGARSDLALLDTATLSVQPLGVKLPDQFFLRELLWVP